VETGTVVVFVHSREEANLQASFRLLAKPGDFYRQGEQRLFCPGQEASASKLTGHDRVTKNPKVSR
jgi:hypothetical protein